MQALIAVSDDDEDNVLALIRAAPGNVSLETMLVEISKLEAIRAIGLAAGLFAGIDARIIAGWRARAAVESPVHLREHPQPTKLALLCPLLAHVGVLAGFLLGLVRQIHHAKAAVLQVTLHNDHYRVSYEATLSAMGIAQACRAANVGRP